jgi:hypothetical protein
MKIYGSRSKPKAWPHALYRVVDGRVEMIVHGMWGRVLEHGSEILTSRIQTEVAKNNLYEYDASIWGEAHVATRQCVPTVVKEQNITVFFPIHCLGAVADGVWKAVPFSIVSNTTFELYGQYFRWVQRSDAALDYKIFPQDKTIYWLNPETSLFTTAVAADKNLGEWLREAEVKIQGECFTYLLNPRNGLNLAMAIRQSAQESIKEKADVERQAELRQQREDEVRKRRELEERKAAQQQVKEKRKAERERLKVLLNKPASELSPEEFAQRMRMRRENDNDLGA